MPLTYKWTRDGEPIAGAILPTYTLTPADANKTILCEVTGENGICTVMVATNSVVTPGLPPVNIIPPVISGLPNEGETLTVTNNGTWTGAPTIVFSYQWRRNGVDIPLENTSSYVLTSTDIGTIIDCVVTGTNLYGFDDAASNYFIICGGASAPGNTVAPVVSYTTLTVGSLLTCSQGTWIGSAPIIYSYQWQRDGVDLVGEISSTYTIVSGDVGRNIRCIVTGTNIVTPIDAPSNVVVPVAAPAFVTSPIIYGDEVPGSILTCSPGTISGTSPITIQYNWQYSTDGGTTWLSYFPPEIASTYTLTSFDLKRLVRCQVTATNSYGTANSVSNVLLIAKAPTIVGLPTISGLLNVPGLLTATDGVWDGTGPFTYTHQWQRNGVDIPGANTNTYTTVSADIGANITVRVGATNIVTTNYAESTETIPVSAPIVIQQPIIYGSAQVGATLTVQDGYYGGYPSSTITRKWQYSTNGGVSWVDYSPAQIGTTYVVQASDVGNLIRVFETADNGYGPTTQASANAISIIAIAVQRPENTVAPAITGTPSIGNTLTCSTGTWNGSPTVFIHQWYRGTTPVGTNSANYTLVSADVDQIISCVVSATNAGGTEPATSNSIYAYDNDIYAVIAHAISNGYALPSTKQLQFFSTIVTELKAYNQWTIHDIFYCTYNDNLSGEAFARINWRNPSLYYLNPVNGPTWAANVGYTLNGSTQYIDTMYNPATNGVAYTLNSAGRYIWIQRPSIAATRVDGNSVSNDNTMLVGTGSNNSINSGTNLPASTNTSEGGFHAIVRTSATNAYRVTNFTSASSTVNIASTAITSANQWIGRSGITYMIANAPLRFYAMGDAIPLANIFGFRSIINKLVNS